MTESSFPFSTWSRLTKAIGESDFKLISRSPTLWMLSASNLRHAAKALRVDVDKGFRTSFSEQQGEMSWEALRGFMMAGPVLMLYGMTMETSLKARYIALNPAFEVLSERGRWWTGHDLRDLADKTGYSLKDVTQNIAFIDDMSAAIQLGRYPFHSRIERTGPGWSEIAGGLVDSIVEIVFLDAFKVVSDWLTEEQAALDAGHRTAELDRW